MIEFLQRGITSVGGNLKTTVLEELEVIEETRNGTELLRFYLVSMVIGVHESIAR